MDNEKAVKIIKWLGWEFTPTDENIDEEFYASPDGMIELQEQEIIGWLERAQGHGAIITKLKSQNEVIVFDGDTVSRCYGQKDNMYEVIETYGSLIKLVLEMIEQEEDEEDE